MYGIKAGNTWEKLFPFSIRLYGGKGTLCIYETDLNVIKREAPLSVTRIIHQSEVLESSGGICSSRACTRTAGFGA